MNEVNHASVFCIIDEAMQRYIKPHHVHIDSLLACALNGRLGIHGICNAFGSDSWLGLCTHEYTCNL